MRALLKTVVTAPDSLMRLLAAWFFACSVFVLLRSVIILTVVGFCLITLGAFAVLTLAQHLLPLPRFTHAALAVSTLVYAAVLVAMHENKNDYPFLIVVLLATAIVLFPLLHCQKGVLLPRPISRRFCIAVVVAAGLLFSAVLGAIGCLRYLTYSSPNYDFGIFVQMFHNMKETLLPMVTCERDQLLSHFAVHISPIYYVLLPFYCVFPSPLTLQIGQVLVLASGLIPLYRLAQRFRLSNGLTALLAVLYAVYPALSTGCFYDLHENCFLVPLLLWLFDCYERGHYWWMILPACLVLATKEDAAVYLAFFAIYLLFSRRDLRRALPLLLGAVVYFVLAIWLLQQFGTGAMFGRYDSLLNADKDTGGLLGTLLRDPAFFLTEITKDETISAKLVWLFQLLLPFGVLLWTPRGKYCRLLLLFPLLLNLLTQYPYQFDIGFQYSFGTLPFLYYLLIQNMADSPHRFRRDQLLFGTLAACLLYMMLVLPSLNHYITGYRDRGDTFRAMDALLETVPDDVSVTASSMLLTHLAQRAEIYEDEYHAIPDTEYVVLDLREGWTTFSETYRELCLKAGYTVVTEVENLGVILKAPQ